MVDVTCLTPKTKYDLDEFDVIFFSAPDVHGVARGRFVFRSSVKGFVKNGLGMTQAALFGGVMCDIPMVLHEYNREGWASGSLLPDVSTLRPLSYLSFKDKKVGQLICDFQTSDGEREISMAREVALSQLKALKNIGYEIWISFELEFSIFKKGTIQPVPVNENLESFINNVLTTLWESGIPVVSVGRGTEDGKLMISVGAEKGIEAADSLHCLRNILKSVCMNSGYDITYMTKPLSGITKNSFHFSMTLRDEQGSNLLTSSNNNNNNNLSDIGQQWAAGLLYHHSALTALCRPTVNCYSSGTEDTEVSASWTSNQTNSSARLYIGHDNEGTFIRDCLPTSACNPYCVLGGIIAAGMMGISQKMSLPQKESTEQHVNKGPMTLSEALDALETDAGFGNSLCSKFIHRFLLLKREYEIEKFKNKDNDVDSFEFERSIYFYSL